MNTDTKLTSKKYKTLGELLNAPIKSIILVSIHEKDTEIKNYLYEWLYLNHYHKKEMIGNLTSRVKNIANNPCYYYIVKNIFGGIDIKNYIISNVQILNSECIEFMKIIHSIEPSLHGVFMDYLIRRIISEKMEKDFYDSKSELLNGPEDFTCDELTINMNDNYEISKNTKDYKTKDIIKEIFITSLFHIMGITGILDKKSIVEILRLLKNTQNIIEILVIPLEELCNELIKNTDDILLNPALGFNIPELDDKHIPSDCDVIIDDVLYDIKCTSGNKEIYEILQLMGYASIINCSSELNKKINTISIINLLRGYIIKYDISYIINEQMIEYLKILT